jgi:hypothetical protein
VGIRCREELPEWLANAMARPPHPTLRIVEKCGLRSEHSAMHVQNVGDEGFGYLEWILQRYDSLPPCAILLHGNEAHTRLHGNFRALLACMRPVRELANSSLAVPLGHQFIPARSLAMRDVGRGLDRFYVHLAARGVTLPDVRRRVLRLWCCNVWLLTARAIRERSAEWWRVMRDAALLRVGGLTPSGKSFAAFGRSPSNPMGHPEIGVIYEHTFHLMLGFRITTDQSTYEALRTRAFDC